jgi:hypothetical protein
LIREAGVGWVVGSSNDLDTYYLEEIASILLHCYHVKQNGQVCCQWKPEVIAWFNWEEQVK